MQYRLMTIAIDHDHVVGCDHVVPDNLVRRRRAVGNEKKMIGTEDARGVALGSGHGPRMVEQLSELVDRVAYVGAQHVLAKKLMKHATNRALQKRDATRMSWAMPRIRSILRVVRQRTEKRRRQRFQIHTRLADDVTRDKFGRVLEHVNEAMQLAQQVIRHVVRGARFAV